MVTEDQDLQAMVLAVQKDAPVQHLRASAMQERVRGAVAQSQVSLQIQPSDQKEQVQRRD